MYQLLFEKNPQPMFVYETATLAVLAVNEAAVAQYGYSRDEFLRLTLRDIHLPEDLPALLVSVSRRTEGLEKVGIWRHKRKDASLVHADITVRDIEWEGRKARLVLATDVTEGRRAAAALSESEEQIRLLLDSTAEGIFGVDLRGICTFCNRACLNMLGFSRVTDLLGQDMHNVCHHSRPDGTRLPVRESRIYQAFRQGQGAHASDEVFWRKDGTSFPAEYWSYPVRSNGELTGYVVSFLDITERRQAEKILESRTAYLNALIENNPLATVVLDSNEVVQMCNPAFANLFQYDRNEVVGHPLNDLIVPRTQPSEARHFGEQHLHGRVLHALTRRARKDGKLVDVEIYGVPLVIDGEVKGSYGIYRDVSEEKLLEQQLRQAQKMEAVGRLAGGVAHDFNNLLSVILGYSEILEEALARQEALRKSAEGIKKAARGAASLTRQLLAFSRQQVLEPRVLNLNTVVSETEKMLRRLLGEDIEIVTKLDSALEQVRVDQGQIEQVILNLAVNARDAMPQGGRLTIETTNVDLDEAYARQHPPSKPGRYVVLTVSDTGIGMDSETQAHIFEPFFTTKEMGRGTGLGLATVYGVVKQSEGYIWVYSEPGHGATFKIHLPRAESAAAPAVAAPRVAHAVHGNETLLVVEDSDSLRELAGTILEGAGYTVLEARNGTEALEVAARHTGTIHALLSDVIMPGMSGRVLAEKLIPLRPEMRVLYVSGYTDDIIVHHGALEPGAVLLQKPFTKQSLLEKVRAVLDEPAGASESGPAAKETATGKGAGN